MRGGWASAGTGGGKMRGEGGDRETEIRQGACTEKREQGEGETETGTDRVGKAQGETERARPRWGD